jgi:transposase InsO family protein
MVLMVSGVLPGHKGPNRSPRPHTLHRTDPDNAVAESFFATLKKELIHARAWPSKAELRTEVFEYIEVFFNRRRRHSTLGMLSPEQFERNHHQQTERITTTAAVAA